MGQDKADGQLPDAGKGDAQTQDPEAADERPLAAVISEALSASEKRMLAEIKHLVWEAFRDYKLEKDDVGLTRRRSVAMSGLNVGPLTLSRRNSYRTSTTESARGSVHSVRGCAPAVQLHLPGLPAGASPLSAVAPG